MKFKNKTKLISFITTASLPLVVGSAVVFGSTNDIVNKNFSCFSRNIKTNEGFISQNYDKQNKNATNEKLFNQLVSSEQKLTPSHIDLMNTNPFSYFETGN